ncbi:DUF4351 domain-containing protein [Trichormus azollae]|uniref:DUF4351 domain-containing protein n=1 Tax=Trichormus azollae TaxID=1164 RepID=UPI00325D2634
MCIIAVENKNLSSLLPDYLLNFPLVFLRLFQQALIIRQINRKLGKIDMELETRIRGLNIEVIEALGEVVFDLDTVEDLQNWLDNLSSSIIISDLNHKSSNSLKSCL